MCKTHGFLVHAVSNGNPLHAHGKSGCIHHDEHVFQAPAFFSHLVANGTAVVAKLQHSGRADHATDALLLLASVPAMGILISAEGARCIYVLDDDVDICRLVCVTLQESGFEATECHTAAALRRLLLLRVPDLCIVDLGLPDADGMDVVRDLQARFACGVIVLTGRGYLSDRVMGLELGADDYVVKPFEPRELVARARSVLRRQEKSRGLQAEMPSQHAEFGGWQFRADSNLLVSPGGQEWTLSAGEARMLLQFLQRSNRAS